MYDTRRKAYHNIPAGCGIILNEKEAFLSTSNYDARDLKQGTVVPVRLKIEIGNEKIVEILQEYHDLTYLNWLAPLTTAKHPLVITIAERFAELTREGVSAENLFYLDL
jgi:argonaute-like protein implicated in RNA metabolism and viral defense